jgi:hypothetical protein
MFLVQTHEVPVNPFFIASERGETGELKKTSCVCIGQHPGIFTDFSRILRISGGHNLKPMIQSGIAAP